MILPLGYCNKAFVDESQEKLESSCMRKSRQEGKTNGLCLPEIMEIIIITVITIGVLFMTQSVAPCEVHIPYLK